SFLRRALAGRLSLCRELVIVEIAEGARSGIQRERVVLAAGSDGYVVERDDARELPDIAREGAHVVVAADHLYRDRALGIELARDLGRRGPEQVTLQPASQTRPVD